jgi:DNA-directed RNA polymerase specialized sigma24 family protein
VSTSSRAVLLLWKPGARPAAPGFVARRYAYNLDDAEDAYQRGLEILLTKAPTTRDVDLVRWLKTVVKHDALALRRQRERHSPITDNGRLGERPTPRGITHDQAALYERLHQCGEASPC